MTPLELSAVRKRLLHYAAHHERRTKAAKTWRGRISALAHARAYRKAASLLPGIPRTA
jgi:hypothetical protein